MAYNVANILVNSLHDSAILDAAKNYLKGDLIDIGCGTKPYETKLAPYVDKHVGVDHEITLHDQSNIDLFGTAYQIPVMDSVFDSAICTAVLEHLEEPELALKECYRVLKLDGVAIYTVPFIWHLHEEPRDFYRFSKYEPNICLKKLDLRLSNLMHYQVFGLRLVSYLSIICTA